MATILFKDAIANPDLIAAFDPAADILLFTDQAASGIKVSGDSASVTFSVGLDSVTLDLDLRAVTSGSSGFIRFLDGSQLVIGDGSAAVVADDLANQHGDFASQTAGDQFIGLGGNDSILTGAGDDLFYGNSGADTIINVVADNGHDTLFGGQGDDYLHEIGGDNGILAYGNLGNDLLFGSGDGDDSLYGGQGADSIYGYAGDDLLYGNAGNDLILAYNGDNTVFGGQGDDTISGDLNAISGSSLLYGNLGDDSLLAGFQDDTVFGGQGNDTIISHAHDAHVFGNDGDDFFAGSGQNLFTGGAGADTLSIDSNGLGFLDFNAAEDVVQIIDSSAASIAANAYGGSIIDSDTRGFLLKGADILLDVDGDYTTLTGGAGQTLTGDNLVLNDGSVFVYNVGGAAGSFAGADGDDVLIAGDSGDTLTSGDGHDTIIGGDGDDLFIAGAGFDDDVHYGGEGVDSISAVINGSTDGLFRMDSIEHITLTWNGAAGVADVGFLQDTTVTVDASSLTVGQDIFMNGNSNGTAVHLISGTGDDTLTGCSDPTVGDTLESGDGDDYINAANGNDIIDGGAGVDTIIGNLGADTMTGGTGADVFAYDNAASSGFTLTSIDHITDFAAADDTILFNAVNALFDERLVDLSSSADLEVAAEAAYAAATGVAEDDAVLFTFGGRTYVFIDDGVAGLSTDDDLLVDITGFTGTVSASNFIDPIT